jgi:hypothetical protein
VFGHAPVLAPVRTSEIPRLPSVASATLKNPDSNINKHSPTNLHCHNMGLEWSSGAENTTKMHSKTSPTQLEGSRVPNSDPKKMRGSRRKPACKEPPPRPPLPARLNLKSCESCTRLRVHDTAVRVGLGNTRRLRDMRRARRGFDKTPALRKPR